MKSAIIIYIISMLALLPSSIGLTYFGYVQFFSLFF